MTNCGNAMTVETYHMTVSVIAKLSGQRVPGGSKLSRLDSLGHFETGGGRCGHAMSDIAWGIKSVRP
jgi:hypothetical protein